MSVCFTEDEYVQERYFGESRWVAELKDGRLVHMDDGRPGAEPQSAWLRLKAFVEQEKVPVVGLKIQFRSHIEAPLLRHQEGYFFAKSLLGSLDGSNFGFFLIGYLQGESIKVQRWKVPELILIEEEDRPANEAGDFLLRNPK